MEDNVPCMKTTFSQPEGSRKNGRPRVRWLHSVLKHLKTLELWKKTRDGKLWSETISEAKAPVAVAPKQKKKKNLTYKTSYVIQLVVCTFTFVFYMLLRTQYAALLAKC
jgi:hypothetical protein